MVGNPFRNVRRIAWVGVTLWVGCSSRPSTDRDAGAGAGGTGGADASHGGTSGDGGSGGLIVVPDGSWSSGRDVPPGTIPFPCIDPTPVVDTSSGYLRCQNGLLHRPVRGVCPSIVPRPGVVAAPDAAASCQRDNDCTIAGPLGHCAPLEIGDGRIVFGCFEGCQTDDQCPDGYICVCGDPVGRCTTATCTSDVDCGASDLFCASYVRSPGCPGIAFACQTYSDVCAVDSNCPPMTQCSLTTTRARVCRIRECVVD